MTAITDNNFVIYSKNYNTTGLDSSYIQPTLMIYLNPADEETFINDQLSTFKESTSLNRMYTQIPTTIKVLAEEFHSSIMDNLRSVPNPGALTQSNATSLENEDVIHPAVLTKLSELAKQGALITGQKPKKVADIKNTGGRLAGASTAAAFIEAFIEKDTKWVHLDIAGTAGVEKTGATGVMVKTFTELFC
jgi:hypothetical protein